jgi:hypothetical protein
MLVITAFGSMPRTINIEATNWTNPAHNYVDRLRKCSRVESDVDDSFTTVPISDYRLSDEFPWLGRVWPKGN